MAYKLTPMHIALVAAGIFVIVAIVMGVRHVQRNNFKMDSHGEYMVGVVDGVLQDYNDGRQQINASHQYHLTDGQSSLDQASCDIDDCAKRGADRANGYGSRYHIVGEKCYECSNDPNELTKVGCMMDDYSQWQTSDLAFKDFNHNPIYGQGECGDCQLRTHDDAQHPYKHKDASCRCSANPNPRHTFESNDAFTHA